MTKNILNRKATLRRAQKLVDKYAPLLLGSNWRVTVMADDVPDNASGSDVACTYYRAGEAAAEIYLSKQRQFGSEWGHVSEDLELTILHELGHIVEGDVGFQRALHEAFSFLEENGGVAGRVVKAHLNTAREDYLDRLARNIMEVHRG